MTSSRHSRTHTYSHTRCTFTVLVQYKPICPLAWVAAAEEKHSRTCCRACLCIRRRRRFCSWQHTNKIREDNRIFKMVVHTLKLQLLKYILQYTYRYIKIWFWWCMHHLLRPPCMKSHILFHGKKLKNKGHVKERRLFLGCFAVQSKKAADQRSHGGSGSSTTTGVCGGGGAGCGHPKLSGCRSIHQWWCNLGRNLTNHDNDGWLFLLANVLKSDQIIAIRIIQKRPKNIQSYCSTRYVS